MGALIAARSLKARSEGLDELIVRQLHLEAGQPNLREWDAMVQKIKRPKHEISVALVGKYAGLKECYKSLGEALVHGGIDHETKVNVSWIESEDVERQGTERILREADGILIPGGFGTRGVEGKIQTIKYAREREVPFLGLCLGMQCATIEFARNVLKLDKAHSTEFDPATPQPVICLLDEQRKVSRKGGTMRLGAQPCQLTMGSRAQQLYGAFVVIALGSSMCGFMPLNVSLIYWFERKRARALSTLGLGLAVGGTIVLGQALRCLHPPAGAVALLGVLLAARPGFVLMPVLAGAGGRVSSDPAACTWGAGGGRVVAQGTPEQVARCKKSYTGQALADYFTRHHAVASPAILVVGEVAAAARLAWGTYSMVAVLIGQRVIGAKDFFAKVKAKIGL